MHNISQRSTHLKMSAVATGIIPHRNDLQNLIRKPVHLCLLALSHSLGKELQLVAAKII